MITRLQISLGGRELRERIAERIRTHEASVSALRARIKQREGDLPFDVRLEDDFKTVGELESQCQHHASRVSELTLIQDNVVAHEVYALSRADLRFADLISSDSGDTPESATLLPVHACEGVAIDGLKLTIAGQEIRSLLERRIAEHQRRAEHWRREQARTPAEETDEDPLLPNQMCENEAERHDWRAEVLGFVRDHINSSATYRLGETDLAFGELLPEKPGWVEQEEYEERTSVGFHLERLTKRLGAITPREFASAIQQDQGEG